MQIFKNKDFHRWSRKSKLTDDLLYRSITDVRQGRYEASLGGNIYKKRIGLRGRGKSGGVRTIIAFKKDDKAFFIYGYEKNVRSNITDKEEKALKALAKIYFNFTDAQINKAVKSGELIEVKP